MGYRDALKAWSSRNRLLLFISAFVIFLIGLALSFNHLDLGQRDLTYISLLFVLIITQPILIILNSAELKLCASASKSQMSFRDSLYVSSSATVANILPLPAGLILRGAALVKGGATATMSAKILMIAALMWVAVALTFSGAAILGDAHSLKIIAAGFIATWFLTAYTARLSNLKIALFLLITRLLMASLLTLQLKLLFSFLGTPIALSGAATYVVSGVAGAVISIVPAGLGIIESFGALLAKLDGASSSLAYIVLTVNRLTGLLLAAIVVLILGGFSKSPDGVLAR